MTCLSPSSSSQNQFVSGWGFSCRLTDAGLNLDASRGRGAICAPRRHLLLFPLNTIEHVDWSSFNTAATRTRHLQSLFDEKEQMHGCSDRSQCNPAEALHTIVCVRMCVRVCQRMLGCSPQITCVVLASDAQ